MDLKLINTNIRNAYHQAGYKGQDCVVHVLDTGSTAVGRLKGVVSGDLRDKNGHGTFVSSQINEGAPLAKIISYQIIPGNELEMREALEKVYIYALANPNKFHIVNMSCSLQAPRRYPTIITLENTINKVVGANVPIVCAAGNDDEKPVNLFPATFVPPICVTAAQIDGKRAKFSNFPNEADFVDWGVGCSGLDIDGKVTFKNGTSMSCPNVVWKLVLIACEYKAYMGVFPLEPKLYDIAKGTVTDFGVKGFDPYFGYGFIDISSMIKYGEKPKEDIIMKGYNCIATGEVNLRDARGTFGKILGVVRKDTAVLGLDVVSGWREAVVYINGDFVHGYLSNSYLRQL